MAGETQFQVTGLGPQVPGSGYQVRVSDPGPVPEPEPEQPYLMPDGRDLRPGNIARSILPGFRSPLEFHYFAEAQKSPRFPGGLIIVL